MQCSTIAKVFEKLQVPVAPTYVSGELQANVVPSIAVSHEVSRQLAKRQHDVTEVEGSCIKV